jgi:hypothetical protein
MKLKTAIVQAGYWNEYHTYRIPSIARRGLGILLNRGFWLILICRRCPPGSWHRRRYWGGIFVRGSWGGTGRQVRYQICWRTRSLVVVCCRRGVLRRGWWRRCLLFYFCGWGSTGRSIPGRALLRFLAILWNTDIPDEFDGWGQCHEIDL